MNLHSGKLHTLVSFIISSAITVSASSPKITDADWAVMNNEIPGVYGSVYAAVKSNGKFYVGGTFHAAGGVMANHIAMWDGSKWNALGAGLDGNVYALAVDKKGIIWVGGDFYMDNYTYQQCLAQWNGTEWKGMNLSIQLKNGLARINALAIDSGGTVYFGGEFDWVGSLKCKNIAKWKLNVWCDSLGPGLNGTVEALAFDDQWNLHAGGWFQSPRGVAKWNGSSWESLGAGLRAIKSGFGVLALAFDNANRLFASGSFDSAGVVAARHIAVWNGTTWDSLGSGLNYDLGIGGGALACDKAGNLYAGGVFDSAGGKRAPKIAKWNGAEWQPLFGGLRSPVNALCTDEGDVFIGGRFSAMENIPASGIAQWNGSSVGALGTGTNGSGSIAFDSKGTMYIGGNFTVIGGVSANYAARWNGNTWVPLGKGLDRALSTMVIDRAGNLYVGGDFNRAGDVAAPSIAKWDGTTWSSMNGAIIDLFNGSVSRGTLYILAIDRNDVLYAGGSFDTIGGIPAQNIARWNGQAWEPVGGGTNQFVETIAFDSSNTLYAGGAFDTAGGIRCSRIARWNGMTWDSLGSGIQGNWLTRIVVDKSGMVYAGGYCYKIAGDTTGNISRWDGTRWLGMGSGLNELIRTLELDDAGNLYVGGAFSKAGKVSASAIARWNGTAWEALGSGTDEEVWRLCYHDKTLYLGGDFVKAGGKFSPFLAKIFLPQPTDAHSGNPHETYNHSAINYRLHKSGLVISGAQAGDVIKLYSLDGRCIRRVVGAAIISLAKLSPQPVIIQVARGERIVALGMVMAE